MVSRVFCAVVMALLIGPSKKKAIPKCLRLIEVFDSFLGHATLQNQAAQLEVSDAKFKYSVMGFCSKFIQFQKVKSSKFNQSEKNPSVFILALWDRGIVNATLKPLNFYVSDLRLMSSGGRTSWQDEPSLVRTENT